MSEIPVRWKASGGPGSRSNGSYTEIALSRFNPDRSLDPSFGGDGVTTVDYYGKSANSASLTFLPDGKIVVAGSASNGSNEDIALARLNPDGSLDKSFDVDGRAMLDLGGSNERANSMAAYDEGRLVVAGYRNNQLAVARISTDVPITSTPFDFNADSQADLAVFRPSDNTWYIQTAEGYSFRAWGQAGDEPAPADYDGDGKTDLRSSGRRPANGTLLTQLRRLFR